MEKGKLFICPTPIGNLEDISIRTLEVFKNVDLVAAEDTRHSGRLLKHYEIDKPFTSYHEHNKIEKGKELIKLLKSGKKIALISDAGMPAISDPGEDLVKLCIEEEIEFTVIPGATASLVGLILSGLDTNQFIFEGFLPSKKNDRIKRLEIIKINPYTTIFYESPHRLVETLTDMEEIFGDRKISVSRELTKIYEETKRGNVSEIVEYFKKNIPRGEFVIVVEGNKEKVNIFEDISIKDHLIALIEDGYTKKDAIKKISEDRDLPRNLIYKESLKI